MAGEIAKALAEDASGSVAVLYRTNAQSRVLEEALRRNRDRLPPGGRIQFLRARGDSATCWLTRGWPAIRAMTTALQRIINTPARGIGAVHAWARSASHRPRPQKLALWEALEDGTGRAATCRRAR